ncbi:Peroxiredoxin [Cnuella takakiae]|uniref:Peroxiredoxin n=1 Tax=Cnuella takakiae TaxID=1302690 RepID=A0A1M5FM46_9BACT|nr:redoxin domain-containing protein [Cnuella takakiae]OLY93715.1 peroxiredoxin [Cnuella takakiae]SHF92563.1 Peroxiredoxin [Cnuella takakiae]
MAIQIGQQAPDFTLVNIEKQPVSLSSFKGQNVVLLFFPLAFSSVCTAELCSVRDEMARYNNLETKVIGISIDSLFTLAKYKEDQQYNFELLSDFNKEVSAAYGALYSEFFGMKGVSKRAAFVIDREGVVRYAEVLEDAGQQPNFTLILKTLEELPLTV